jgi:hypothetical protein
MRLFQEDQEGMQVFQRIGKEGKVKITDWFNPLCLEHIKAYQHLRDKGSWPSGFLPKEVDFPIGWQTIIAFKLANEWVASVLQSAPARMTKGRPPE